MDLEEFLYNSLLPVIKNWQDNDVYAISFFVYSNEAYEYNQIVNFPEFTIGYNTEESCNYAPQLSEDRWSLLRCRKGEVDIIKTENNNEGAKFLFNWYKTKGIVNIGFEDETSAYDGDMKYIGKGPNGYYELLCAVSNVAKRLQTDDVIASKFGHIPIIVHDFEYAWYIEEATKNANPNGEADAFLKAFRTGFHD